MFLGESSPHPHPYDGFPPPYQHELTISIIIPDNSSYIILIPTLYGSEGDHYMEARLQAIDGGRNLSQIIIQDGKLNISANGSIIIKSIIPYDNNTKHFLHLGHGDSPPFYITIYSYKESGPQNITIKYQYIQTNSYLRTHISFASTLKGDREVTSVEYQMKSITAD